MIAGKDTDVAELTAITETLARLVEAFSEVSASLSAIGQQLGASAAASAMAGISVGAQVAGTTGTGGGAIESFSLPRLPETFSNFLSDAFAGGGLFENTKKEKEGDVGADDAEKVKALSKEASKSQVNDDEEQKKSDKKLWAAKLANAIAGSKKLAKVRKAYAVGTAVVNTALGITETFKNLGFPAAIPPAAALAAAAAKQISVIKGQTHDGLDKIPSSGTYLLEKGERVVGKRLNQDLSSFLGTASGPASTVGLDTGGSVANFDRSTSNSSNFNPTINLTVGNGASDDAVGANRREVETMIREIYADYAQASPFLA